MKVTICSPIDPCNGYHLYVEDEKIPLSTPNTSSKHWDESDLTNILTDNEYKQFESGKYEFDLPKWKIDLIKGVGTSRTKERLYYSAKIHS